LDFKGIKGKIYCQLDPVIFSRLFYGFFKNFASKGHFSIIFHKIVIFKDVYFFSPEIKKSLSCEKKL
jgi:hypothetical protein